MEGNGSLDLNIVLSDLLVFRMVYSPKYVCDFKQLFQFNTSVFPKVTNYIHLYLKLRLLLQLKLVTFGRTEVLN